MYEPAINKNDFIVDFCIGLPASKLKKKHILTNRQYRYLLEKLDLSRRNIDEIRRKNMNLLNEKAKVLRVQLEAEKGKDNPSWYKIQKLEEELDKVLSVLM